MLVTDPPIPAGIECKNGHFLARDSPCVQTATLTYGGLRWPYIDQFRGDHYCKPPNDRALFEFIATHTTFHRYRMIALFTPFIFLLIYVTLECACVRYAAGCPEAPIFTVFSFGIYKQSVVTLGIRRDFPSSLWGGHTKWLLERPLIASLKPLEVSAECFGPMIAFEWKIVEEMSIAYEAEHLAVSAWQRCIRHLRQGG